ncbi:MAG TPA: hypothetical protein VK177_00005, partial [Flavobacteriales bacterium]|nr:hypothetical protein [Flavobacteriales bacterium]
MKKFTSILLVIFWSALGRAQNTATLQWNNTIAGTTSGSDNGIVSFTDNAGNTYAAGTNQNGLFVAKFDNTGAVVQHFQHVDTNNTALSPKIIQTDAMNNIYVGGDKFFDGVYQVSFAKFDPTGNLLWMKDYSNAAGFGNIQSISADNNVSPNYFCYTGYVGDSLWVGKFDVTTSDFAWNTKLIPAGYINAKGLHVSIKSSNIYVAGQTMGTFTNDDALLIRFNALGTLTYLTTLNGSASSQDIAYKVIVNSSGEAFLFGTAYNPGLQYFVSKYDIVGGTSWTSYSGVPAGETIAQAHDLAFNATYSKVYALGSSNHAVTNGNGNIMIFTASSGALAHSAVINFGTENEMPKDLIVDNSENYYIVGSKSNGFLGVKYNSSNALSYTLSYTDLNYWLGSHLDLSGNLFICGTASSTVTLGDVVLKAR